MYVSTQFHFSSFHPHHLILPIPLHLACQTRQNAMGYSGSVSVMLHIYSTHAIPYLMQFNNLVVLHFTADYSSFASSRWCKFRFYGSSAYTKPFIILISCCFLASDSSDFMPDGSLEDSMSRGEGLDLVKRINRDGMAREEVLEATLREVIDTKCNRMGDLITGWDNKLEGMKANLSDCSRQLEGVVYEEDIEEVTRKADEAITKANILDARLRKSQDDYSDLKADTTRSITALEEQVHLLKQESRQFQAALQANTRALERLEQAEWRQVEANAAAAATASTSAARKGKGKRKRRDKSHAPVVPPVIPPTSSEAMANARNVM